MLIVDAHEDIAYNMVAHGRDYRCSAKETRQREREDQAALNEMGQCMLGLPDWLDGGVGIVFGTLFTLPARFKLSSGGAATAFQYTTPQEAHAQAMRQVDVYARLADENPRLALIRTQRELEAVLATWKAGAPEEKRQVGIVMLMEGADPIVQPQRVEEWYERGVRIVGPAWVMGTRYAGGNGAPGPLTDEGVRLLRAMLDFNMALDVSHLSDQACLQALELYDGPVLASHSNPRSLVPGPRQLSNDMLKALLAREGVVGILPVSPMLKEGWRKGDRRDEVTLERVIAAIDAVCQMAGDAQHVGIGSDFDGGFGAESAPAELDTVADVGKIADALKSHGYAAADVEAVMSGNWLRLLRRVLP